ncbi:alpha/beta hydrolase family protein [Pontimicrobium aquaticum]|uniref:Alpha/beta hydrolase n=1 Tax=Pontimicrobium aquaticum TaxID=2565367 RepID=A0A4U0EWW6_9FLAO|nr:alpha/beta fold hydrolase [Pontimicrobium aquaticum]TJY36435.1 alpha/beta hydrolase [Pontimicrobium aquaticum]
MKNIYLCICLLFFITSCKQNTSKKKNTIGKSETTEISFYTKDSLKIYGDLFEISKTAPTILLFHQGGANSRGEYQNIIPILKEEGFNVLTIDQRRGGQRFGSYNRTVAEIPKNTYDYCDAYLDLEAALEFVKTSHFTGKKIVWGSSYSATLCIKLASKNTDAIDGVLAFSPASGEPMEGCRPEEILKTLKTPLLLLRPSIEAEIESVKTQLALAKEYNHETYVTKNGVHGSSMLVEDRVGSSIDENWEVVKTFLNKYKQ